MLARLMMSEPIRAEVKLSMAKPVTKLSTKMSMKALITKLKSPKVIMVIGKVKKTMIGLIIALTTARTKATKRAKMKPSTVIPPSILTPGKR